ncbi:unnamed protein product [Cuscuta campestris]|uniref:DEAD-box ATP-dependent RNA helicase 33 n=1 Tax=Cuscuta campestris TaxID=132261 RepID=A0A484KBE9_9ASTE|nr:unnamed protein product [Cuscuta campestris]
MALLHSSLSATAIQQSLAPSISLLSPTRLPFLHAEFPRLRLAPATTANRPFRTTTICMGGGPRTFPGGVTKWQWKRMQAKKSKQLLKARLARERQIYEMRKRAELKAAISELERPWEAVEKAPTLFSVRADEQLKVLADRFQKPGGIDLWSEKDGPELFKSGSALSSDRKIVQTFKPYGKIEDTNDGFVNSVYSGQDSLGEDNQPRGMNKTNFHGSSRRTSQTNSLDRERNDFRSDEQNSKRRPKGLKSNSRKGNIMSSSSSVLQKPDPEKIGRVNSANNFINGKVMLNRSKSVDMVLQGDDGIHDLRD